MGCDIHAFVERKINGSWHMLHRLQGWGEHGAYGGERDYDFFAHLAGVRDYGGKHPLPKGLPQDVSVVCQYESDYWDVDGHSHSYDSVNDFVDKKLALMKIRGDDKTTNVSRDWYEYKILGYEIGEDENRDLFRVVYWFDN